MNIAIIDYGSGNISSVINSFKAVCLKQNIEINIAITSDLKKISNSDKVILPGQGSFKNCMESLIKIEGLKETLTDFAITNSKPLFGICVGMQMFGSIGLEESETKGLGWISGSVTKIDNQNNKYKLPHIGWNEIALSTNSKLFKDLGEKPHVYFVHSYHFTGADSQNVLATTQYGDELVAVIGRDNMVGTQFHPEKSQASGLRLISNFLAWSP